MQRRLPLLPRTLPRRAFVAGCIAAIAAGGCAAGDPAAPASSPDGGPFPEPDAARRVRDAGARDALAEDAGLVDAGDLGDVLAPDAGVDAAVGEIVGKPSDYSVGTATRFFDELYVVRDAAGLFAISAICTHRGCTVDILASRAFECPCHQSTFDANGAVTNGPALIPLVHYPLFVDDAGDLVVDRSRTVPPTTRLVA